MPDVTRRGTFEAGGRRERGCRVYIYFSRLYVYSHVLRSLYSTGWVTRYRMIREIVFEAAYVLCFYSRARVTTCTEISTRIER